MAIPAPSNRRRKRTTPMAIHEAIREVKPIHGEPLRFMVPSRSHYNSEYLVDLQEYKFNGQCACRDFECRHSPATKLPGFKPSNASRCWHIQVARAFFLHVALVRAAAAHRQGGGK